MKTPARIAALIVAALAAYALPAAAADAAAGPPPPLALFAAPAGSGSTCTATRPCSLPAAAAKVRTLDRRMNSDIDVDLFGGDYRLASTLQLGPQDSGTNGFHVVYRAVPGQHPVLSGADRVTGFAPMTGADASGGRRFRKRPRRPAASSCSSTAPAPPSRGPPAARPASR